MARKRANSEGTAPVKRADGRWAAAVSLADGKRRWVYGKTRAVCAAKLTEALKAVKDGAPMPSERQTTATFLARWLEDVAKPGVRPSTFASYRTLVNFHMIPALGKVPLAKLSPQDVQAMLNKKRAGGLSARRVQYIRACLRTALNRALRWGLVTRNAAALTISPKMERYEIKPWTPEHARAFLAHVREDRLLGLYTLALATGARQGELLALQWPDVDFDARTVRLNGTLQRVEGELVVCPPKTEKGRRTIALPERIMGALRVHRVRQLEERLQAGAAWTDSAFVFTTDLGRPLDSSSTTHRFQKLVKRAGLPMQRFHDLRHAAASFLLAQGVPARVVMEILGHSQISLTLNTYSHVVPSLQRDATDRLGALLAGEG
jgi:integrase